MDDQQPKDALVEPLGPAGMPENARCIDCGYQLRGLPGEQCPECGRSFDAANPATYHLPNTYSWQRWAKPPSTRSVVWTCIATLLVLEGASTPGGVMAIGVFPMIPVPCIGPLFVAAVLIYGAYVWLRRALAVRRLRDFPGDAAARFTASWFVVPVCWCFVVTAVISGWPMQLRFELSRAAFEREVQTILSGNSTAKSRTIGSGAMTMIYLNKPVGLYFVDTVCVSPTGMSFTTNGVGLSTFGFSCNTSAPVNTPGLSGRWRTFSHDK